MRMETFLSLAILALPLLVTGQSERPTCPNSEPPRNGQVQINGDVATYSCDNGYQLIGNSTRYCLSGTWTGEIPSCQLLVCREMIKAPQNGKVTVIGTNAYFKCDNGYLLVGNQTRFCPLGIAWQGTSPTCFKDCTKHTYNISISTDARYQRPYQLDIYCPQWNDGTRRTFSVNASTTFSITIDWTTPVRYVLDLITHISLDANTIYEIEIISTDRQTLRERIPLRITAVEVNDLPMFFNGRSYLRLINIVEGQTVLTDMDRMPFNTINITEPDLSRTGIPPKWSEIKLTSPDLPRQLVILSESTVDVSSATIAFYLEVVEPFDADVLPIADEEELEPSMRRRRRRRRKRQLEGPGVRAGEIIFTLVATDGGGLSTYHRMTLLVLDINDNAPVCTDPPAILIQPVGYYSSIPNANLFTFCTDADISPRHRIKRFYFFNRPKCIDVFTINPRDPTLSANFSKLPAGVHNCSMTIFATDGEYGDATTLQFVFAECTADVDDEGIFWNVSKPGEMQYRRCPTGYDGDITRRCNYDAVLEPPIKNCTNRQYNEIYYEVRYNKVNATKVLRKLSNITADNKNPLLSGDLQTIHAILEGVTKSVDTDSQEVLENTEDFLSVVDTLLGENNIHSWQGCINMTGYGAEAVLNDIDLYVEKITNTSQDSIVPQKISKTNIYLSIGKADDCQNGVNFPDRSGAAIDVPQWARSSADHIQISCNKETTIRAYSTAMYKNITAMIPARLVNVSTDSNKSSETVNSAVLSMSYYPKIQSQLATPVTITLQAVNRALVDPQCSFWKYDVPATTVISDFRHPNPYTGTGASRDRGAWATDGCWLHSYTSNTGVAVCKCDHLTNFAIIMSPGGHVAEHDVALSIISLIGCIISMLALVLTVAVYVYYWKIVRGDRAFILVNICVALFLAYLIFLAGVDKTANKDGCTLVAVLLHYIFLVVFLLMLTEGIQTASTILRTIKPARMGVKLVLASYGLAAVIVAIAMGASGLEGYGSDTFCWLSVDSGLIWAFLAPTLVVILVNVVIIVLVMRKLFSTVAMSKKSDKEKAKTFVRSTCVLLPVMGVTWIFGIFSVNSATVVFQYLFAIFNSLQGLLIFIFHVVLNRKIQESFKKTKDRYMPSESTGTEMSKSKSTAETNTTMVK